MKKALVLFVVAGMGCTPIFTGKLQARTIPTTVEIINWTKNPIYWNDLTIKPDSSYSKKYSGNLTFSSKEQKYSVSVDSPFYISNSNDDNDLGGYISFMGFTYLLSSGATLQTNDTNTNGIIKFGEVVPLFVLGARGKYVEGEYINLYVPIIDGDSPAPGSNKLGL